MLLLRDVEDGATADAPPRFCNSKVLNGSSSSSSSWRRRRRFARHSSAVLLILTVCRSKASDGCCLFVAMVERVEELLVVGL